MAPCVGAFVWPMPLVAGSLAPSLHEGLDLVLVPGRSGARRDPDGHMVREDGVL